ncbi:mannose-1-phosphate guanyltransferase [Entophlyctis luteolus]|nr:mannose-1-phosphate guanyltransferase [Entophlyctis luteolus]
MAANVAAPAPPQQFLTVFVIVRKDLIKTLNWPLGAVIGNACHATAAVLHKFRADERVQAYLSDLEGMRKPVTRLAREVVLETKNEASLDKVEGMLAEHGVKYHKWIEQPEGIAAAIATAPCYRDEVQDGARASACSCAQQLQLPTMSLLTTLAHKHARMGHARTAVRLRTDTGTDDTPPSHAVCRLPALAHGPAADASARPQSTRKEARAKKHALRRARGACQMAPIRIKHNMKALILVGGFGTRLRPLTFTKPKPLVEFANRHMILHQIEALAKAFVGVTDIILAVNYQPDVMVEAMTKVEEEYGVKVHFSIEPEPLGTGLALLSPESRALTRATNMHQRPPTRRAAGPLALARDILLKNNDVFFVLNADVICEFPFAALLAFHNSHGGEGTLMTTRVEDPSKFGVVLSKPGSTQIQRFVEKPVEFVGDQINAGIYVFTVDILKRIENRPMSIEKDVFPNMARDGQLHSIPLQGFWADVGQPKDFLKGTGLYLASLQANPQASLQLAPRAAGIVGNVLIHETAVIGADCKIGPDVTIGPGVKVGKGVRLSKCVLMKSAVVKDVCSVLTTAPPHGAANTQARLDNTTVLGEDVHVADEVYVNGGSVLPHKRAQSVGTNIVEPQIVM